MIRSNLAIITTINDIQDTYIKRFTNYEYDCIVVGDIKTPSETYKNLSNIHYIESECKVFSELSDKLPFNHYCRKNLGYLHAVKQGAKIILDTDDDNFLTGDMLDWRTLQYEKVLGESIPNILTRFTDHHIWSRGYPIELVNKSQSITTDRILPDDINNVGIIQSLVDGDPDVDAIFRLTSNAFDSDFQFKKGIGFIFNKQIFTQGNTQATLWISPELFHLLYIPTTVSFRFCDILKMYIAQRCMWEYNKLFAVTSPYFYQKRNAHDYMKDFNSEVSMYKCLHELLTTVLPKIKLNGDKEDLIRVYEKLAKHNIVKDTEIVTAKQFIKLTN